VIGYGSQGRAWSQCLTDYVEKSSSRSESHYENVRVYLARKGPSWQKAVEDGLEPALLDELPRNLSQDIPSHHSLDEPPLVVLLCPDDRIPSVYGDFLSQVKTPLTLVLGHGYVLYEGTTPPLSPGHEWALLAPKAIGPQLRRHFQESMESDTFHSLKMGFFASETRRTSVLKLAESLRFKQESLVPVRPELEAVGDLISEQGLLCGTLLTFMEWTLEAMESAGVPPQLIREECFTELELVAGLVRDQGPAKTLEAISTAARAGAVSMKRKLESKGAKTAFQLQVQETLSKDFAHFLSERKWEPEAQEWVKRFQKWEEKLK